ncbi:type II toxin-antitoxin system HicB family antitoxin [Methylobacterium sp. J-072]|uniref:type II toxin-antitoxin system HicB family antitoxin n=1 Tax=Methylobacterium sp. J-072 TaxID=2836651 RepID=UPI001FBA1F4C|nr:type II toxin-antitoxin system HicB family antitoxin [Methylobacterium sp. J-072]MCJ2092639.1 type II toxin-antitoxin system HicB family antitoxin [Methylobacterium sp. J-072]
MTPYIGLIHPPIGASEWGVTFPDVPGCVSAGPSFEAAVDSAREALSGHLTMLASEGLPPPSARTLAELRADPTVAEDLDGAMVQLVAPRRVPGERVRVNIMIDKGLLRLTDEAAEAKGLSRSAFIEAALVSAAES